MHKFCETGDEAIQCVITNRHVIAESASCELVFRSKKVGADDSGIVPSTVRFNEGLGHGHKFDAPPGQAPHPRRL